MPKSKSGESESRSPAKGPSFAYTFYILGSDGYLVGGTPIHCANDADALDHAKKLLGTFNASVEVWNGDRKVGRIDA